DRRRAAGVLRRTPRRVQAAPPGRRRRRPAPDRRHRPDPADPDRRTAAAAHRRERPHVMVTFSVIYASRRHQLMGALTTGSVRNRVLEVENAVPAVLDRVAEALADRAVADRRAAYAAEARRLIDAAFVVMRREDTIDPGVRAVVQEAGLSNQAFYRHFASKDALLLAVLADGQRQLVEHLRRP